MNKKNGSFNNSLWNTISFWMKCYCSQLSKHLLDLNSTITFLFFVILLFFGGSDQRNTPCCVPRSIPTYRVRSKIVRVVDKSCDFFFFFLLEQSEKRQACLRTTWLVNLIILSFKYLHTENESWLPLVPFLWVQKRSQKIETWL